MRVVPHTLRKSCLTAFAALAFFASTAGAQGPAPPDFSKAFSPATIGPGSTSTLTLTIDNSGSSVPVTALAFTDTLPAGVAIQTPASASTTCTGAVLAAPAGGGTITFSGGAVGAFTTCRVRVNVTSATPGTHVNVSGDLTSSAGNSGTAAADLTVATDRPGFSKSFSLSSIGVGGRSTLTFIIDNSANGSTETFLSFTDNLPVGLVVADPANALTDCLGATLTATAGASVISLFGGAVVGGATCSVTVDVTGVGIGAQDNVSSDLFLSFGSSGKAAATIQVTGGAIVAQKAFLDDPVVAGDTVALRFIVSNRDRNLAATAIAFTDDLDATLSGLVATGLPLADPCGPGSILSGTSLLSLTGGNLPAEGSCTFSVTLQVPAGAVPGAYPNVTSSVTADLGGSPIVGAPATETLFVDVAPLLAKTFLADPVGAGDTATIEFTITNTSTTSPVSDIEFLDNLTAFMSGVSVTALPAPGFCGAGSVIFATTISGELFLSMTGGNLPAGASCTFTVDILVAAGTAPGSYVNTTEPIRGTVDGTTRIGRPATATLTVAAAPRLAKEFTDDPVLPGGTMTLEFTLTNPLEATGDATAIMFTDDLTAALTGLSATGLPQDDVCGTGSQISGTTSLSFTGGSLASDASCAFSVTLQVPAGALAGTYTNTTSNVVATVGGLTVTGPPAEDDFRVAGLSLSKTFTDDPVIPGATVNLSFTLDNSVSSADASGIFFTDSLSAVLPGLVATGLPMNGICGVGSSITGTSSLTFTGGNLLAGETCTFAVTLQVPAGAVDGTYRNTTSDLTATVGGSPVVLPPASDVLEVSSELLFLAKTFLDDPASPSEVVSLEFSIDNLDGVETVTGISFTDDLDAALSGQMAVGLPQLDVCGTGSMIAGSGLVTLTGGTLPPGGNCTFSIDVMVPASAPRGSAAVNTTSTVSGMVGGLAVTGNAATDTLRIEAVAFQKSFDGPTAATGTTVLTFSIENLSTTTAIGDLAFSDDLGATLPGLAATGLPMSNVCGAGSVLAGPSFLTFTGGNLLPGGSCTFMVTLQVPAGATPGTYLNTTSDLRQAGLPIAGPATATLVVEPPPAFAKSFAPAVIGVGENSTLTLTIDNTASAVAATALAVTDNLPPGLVVATPAGASTTCGAGTVTANAGAGIISLTGGAVAAGASCTVQANVTASATGALVNTTGDLTSSSGVSGTASATLTVRPQPIFTKAFAPAAIPANGVSTLTLTIDNAANNVTVGGLAFTDTLPTGVVVASPANASTDCGGTLTAAAGSGTIALAGASVAALGSCTVSVDTTSAAAGSFLNTVVLETDLGPSGPAQATLVVASGIGFTKTFLSDPVLRGGQIALEFTITNPSADVALDGLAFTDDLDAVIPGMAALGLPAADVCGPGSQLTGTATIALSGGRLGAAASCTFTVIVQVPADAPLGTFMNTTSPITATPQPVTLGGGGNQVTGAPASDDLTVAFLDFEKTFDAGPVSAGAVTPLTFVITSPDPVNAATGISFTDDLDAAVPGMTAQNLPLSDVCGAGSQLSGSSVISLTGGSLGPGASCTFIVDVLIPSDASGSFTNITSPLAAVVAGNAVAGDTGSGAVADLEVAGNALAIPTLGTWGLLLLVLSLIGAAVHRMRLGG